MSANHCPRGCALTIIDWMQSDSSRMWQLSRVRQRMCLSRASKKEIKGNTKGCSEVRLLPHFNMGQWHKLEVSNTDCAAERKAVGAARQTCHGGQKINSQITAKAHRRQQVYMG